MIDEALRSYGYTLLKDAHEISVWENVERGVVCLVIHMAEGRWRLYVAGRSIDSEEDLSILAELSGR